MVREIRIYYEGDPRLKPGFSEFFRALVQKAHEKRIRFSLISGDSGPEACRDFELARKKHASAWNILLIDSEGPDNGKMSSQLCASKGWPASQASYVFWMVEMMEAWFHADRERVREFYGAEFNESSLKPNPNVEQISKRDLEDGLKRATEKTTKGKYSKTRHAPELLQRIRPDLVQKAAPNCKRLFDEVLKNLQ